ncbi:UTP--glucose-1-phosphate uridylyltransferase [Luteimicrobium subarcticum]|uniref:UTP--glucose-1-phosphate uridylyltransferase n=1 Tax=Luteimicrobium subarcticum TaxID=620910 RepID=A0A2M8W3P2_9MICO|nr:UTP--glucose-1-phosphate uridylyltransferase [Luteimicrobium subarcticum]PJI85553.1 UTP--glucose-1-phosphate uridylyltransferase [Luteimicrobium subarcticum]
MTESNGLALARDKMTEVGVPTQAIEAFTRLYHELERGAAGTISEADVRPLEDVPVRDELDVPDDVAQEAFAATAVIKLNGGLGTSMGIDRAKSLLPVRGDDTFLDLIAGQVLAARERHGVRLPLVLMNSFRTREDTLAALERYPDLAVEGVPADFLQNREPKLRADDLTPVEWAADPELEWCPPGHGDLYVALVASGVLAALRDAGFRYASVSNADNLGAFPDPRMAGWFAGTGAGFAAEVAQRTPADRKGGHLVVRASDGRLVLRETAQVANEDKEAAGDIARHRFFNTNNLWLDLDRLAALLDEHDGVLPLPLIRNDKTVDPTDASSTPVVQVETAMGAAIELFDDAAVVEVDRTRFLPVKTTNDLLLLRSDVYEVRDDSTVHALTPEPFVDLDPAHFKTLREFDARFPAGPPSLVLAESLVVRGDWTFGVAVSAVGAASLADPGEPAQVADDATVGADGVVEPLEKTEVPDELDFTEPGEVQPQHAARSQDPVDDQPTDQPTDEPVDA